MITRVLTWGAVLCAGFGCSENTTGSAPEPASETGGSGQSTGGAMTGSAGTGNPGGTSNLGGTGAGGTSGGSMSTGGSSAGSSPLAEPPFDWVGIIGTGQSLSTGADSVAISTAQPFHNLMLLDEGPDPKYPIDGSETAVWSTVPLTEPHRPNVFHSPTDNYQYPDNIEGKGDLFGETPQSGMANTISSAWAARYPGGDYVTVHSVVGMGGTSLTNLDKTGPVSFKAALSEARVFQRLATEQGKTYGIGGVILTHGEADTSIGTTDYGERLYQMWQDYNADLKTITGQTRDIVVLVSQQSSTTTGDDAAYGTPAVQAWRVSHDHPDQVVITEAKYAYGPYWTHMPAPGYERIGEKYGEVFDLIVNQGVAWKPVSPKSVSLSGKVITVELDVPNPPLVWDDDLVQPHQEMHTAWAAGRGFEVKDAGGNEVAIESVEISGDSVLLTLVAEPSGPLVLGYALTADAPPGQWGGVDVGPHGQLRDSDSFEGFAVETLVVQVTSGSDIVQGEAGAFGKRGWLDIVSGDGLAADTKLMSFNFDGSITLSEPWTGATGSAMLRFHHNHYNYGVHFAVDVP